MKREAAGALVYLCSETIGAPHLFTTRLGGVSRGVYATLNTSFTVGDDDRNVHENIDRAARAIGFCERDVVCSNQVHSDACVRVGKADVGVGVFREKFPFPADALITDETDVLLLVRSADCTPILLWDPARRAVAAIHSGWRGTLSDIAGKTVEAMRKAFGTDPADLRAAIGPCIGAESFEVGDEVAQAFSDAGFSRFIVGGYAKPHVDVAGVCAHELARRGVPSVDVCGDCTMKHNDLYFSHRAQGAKRGLLAALIGLAKENRT